MSTMANNSKKESHASAGKILMEETNNWLGDDEKEQRWAKAGVEVIDNEDDVSLPPAQLAA